MRKRISIVIPIYNEEENIGHIYKSLCEIDREKLSQAYDLEIIFCDNQSTDHSFKIIEDLHGLDPRVRGIQLSRNFGYQANILTGYLNATGDAVIQLDADGEDPPHLIPQFIQKWEEGYDVVYGVRKHRDESLLITLQRKLFYRLLRKIAQIDLPVDAGDFRLVDRKVIDAIKSFPESNPYLRGLICYIGFKQIGIPYERSSRMKGKSKFSWFDLVRLGWDGIASFSALPLKASIFLGFSCSFLSLVGLMYHLYLYIIQQAAPPGFYTLITVILFIAGIQMICIGFMGEYISRIFENVKMRPRSIVSKNVGFEVPPQGA